MAELVAKHWKEAAWRRVRLGSRCDDKNIGWTTGFNFIMAKRREQKAWRWLRLRYPAQGYLNLDASLWFLRLGRHAQAFAC
eukprot:1155297-Pelagomonas_calceolata.AAC.2